MARLAYSRASRPAAFAAGTALALFLAAGASMPAQAGTQLIQNGNFTLTPLSAGGFICQNGSGVGSTCTSNLTDWTATCSINGCAGTSTPGSLLFAGPTDVVVTAFNGGNGLYPTIVDPPTGGNILAVDGDSQYNQTISQTITGLTKGDHYQLTFYQGAAQQSGLSGATTEQWEVTFGSSGTQYSTLMNNASKGVVGWNLVTMNFTATAASEVLSFLSLGTPGGEPPVVLLADVSMFDIPEPGSFALLGLGGLLMLRNRKRAAA